METMIDLITVMAWFIGSCAAGLVLLRLVGRASSSDIDRMADEEQGRKRNWSILTPLLIALICLLWVIWV